MLQSRTVRTLTTLFVAMTIGALSLMWMETAPIDELPLDLTARVSDEAVIFRTHVLVNPSRWLNVVVRMAPSADDKVAKSCHFIVSSDDAGVTTTDLWKWQQDGYHTFAPGHDWNSDSIGVCFVGQLNDEALQARQFNELMVLMQRLQRHFEVRPERVYLHSELDDRTTPPSGAFVRAFSRRLLQ
jgi:hypothetical protein